LALGSGNSTFPGGIHIGGTGSANLLDDYEEGTFTPSIRGAGDAGSWTYTGFGGYTKVGRQVTVTIQLGSITGSGGSGYLQITGLPFTKRTNYHATTAPDIRSIDLGGSNTGCVVEFITSGGATNVVYLRGVGDNIGGTDVPLSGLTSGSSFIAFNLTYDAQ